jgi:hypothetical protein
MASSIKDAAREARRQIADHRGAWRNRLLADRRVSNAAKVVGCAIAEHINRVTKEASVGVRRLAQILHMSQSQVSEAIHELVNAGLIDVQWGAGKKSSTFKLIINLETPDLFLFDKYALDDFAEAARVRPDELSSVRPAERKKGRQSSPGRTLEGPLAFEESARSVLKNARSVLPGEQNPVLTPDNPSKSAPPARSSARVERGNVTETETTSVDAAPNPAFDTVDAEPTTETPMQRAEALHETVEANQPPPCRATSKKMGRPVNADPAERMRWVQFLNVVSAWPQDHVGDEVSAYAVFSRIMGAGRSLHAVINAVKSTRLDYDDDPPSLTSVLMTIEHNP